MNYFKTLMVGLPLAGAALLGANSCSHPVKINPHVEQHVGYMPGDEIKSIGYQIRPQTKYHAAVINTPDTLPVINGDVFEHPYVHDIIYFDEKGEHIKPGTVYKGKHFPGHDVYNLHDSLSRVAKNIAKLKK